MVRRRLREEKELKRRSIIVADTMYDAIADEELLLEKMKTEEVQEQVWKDLTLLDFSDRLFEEVDEWDDCRATEYARTLIEDMPKELRRNLNEYLDNKPLSDIKIHNVSINDVMEIYKPLDFHLALRIMTDWKEVGYSDEFRQKMLEKK